MRRYATPILLLLLPLAAFLFFFHPATLDIGNPGWLIRGTDNGENALGTHAYLHDPAAGASLRTHLLNAPDGVPVLYTDSNPLVTLAAKPFASLLPADAQLIGPFILLNLILQAVFAWLLLRPHAPGRLALWAGVVLLAFPPTLANRFVHTNLMAHWTILAALWIFLDPKRGEQLRWWAPLIAITALIHSYLLIMVGAIWASAMMDRFLRGRGRLAVVLQGVAMLLLVGVLAWWLSVGGEPAAGKYGAFSMPLDALWNAQLDHFSFFLPASELVPGRGFEGFQYMGLGGLLLVVLAIVGHWKRPVPATEQAVRQRARALVPALIVLTILSIALLPLPAVVLAVLDAVRASGRLFWPVGYVLVLMLVLIVYRLPAERAGQALVALIAVQIIDLSGMAYAVRAQSAEAGEHRLYVRTLDPRWDALVDQARDVAFIPGDVTSHLDVFQEVAWRAVKAGHPTTAVYAARSPTITEQRLMRDRKAFNRGELVPGRLYVLRPDVRIPAAAAPYVVRLDGIPVIPASSPR